MTPHATVVPGIIKPDGTLELEEKLSLPAGRAQVTVLPIPDLPKDDPFWQMMEKIWEGQKARGHVPQSVAEVESARQAMREEWDERMQQIDGIQAEARKVREQGA